MACLRPSGGPRRGRLPFAALWSLASRSRRGTPGAIGKSALATNFFMEAEQMSIRRFHRDAAADGTREPGAASSAWRSAAGWRTTCSAPGESAAKVLDPSLEEIGADRRCCTRRFPRLRTAAVPLRGEAPRRPLAAGLNGSASRREPVKGGMSRASPPGPRALWLAGREGAASGPNMFVGVACAIWISSRAECRRRRASKPARACDAAARGKRLQPRHAAAVRSDGFTGAGLEGSRSC